MTINRQFYCMSLFNNNCQSYTAESAKHGVQKASKGNGDFDGGREAGFLCRHLEGVNRGSLGTEYCSRVSDTFQGGTTARSKASRGQILKRTRSSIERRDRITFEEGCYLTSGTQHRRLLLHSVLSPQEEWTDETCHQSKTTQPVGGDPSLQDGGYLDPMGPTESWGLDGESRSEGCLLHHPNPSSTPTVPEVHSGRQTLPILMPSIRPVLCPVDIYQSNETSDGSIEDLGYPNNNLHR